MLLKYTYQNNLKILCRKERFGIFFLYQGMTNFFSCLFTLLFKKFMWLGNQKNLPNRSQNCILFGDILRRLSKLSDDRTKIFCYFSVTGGKRNSSFCFPLWLMVCGLFFYLVKSFLGLQSLFVYLPWWKSLGFLMPILFQILLFFPSWSSNTFHLRFSLVWRDAV